MVFLLLESLHLLALVAPILGLAPLILAFSLLG